MGLGLIHTGSGSVPDSSEPYASGRLRVGFAFTLQKTDANCTRPLRRVHTASASRPVVTQLHLHVLNSWHMSPLRVMWIVSVEINRAVCRHAQTVRRSLPDAPDASTRAFTLQSQADANRSRPLRTHPDVVSVYRTNPTQWTQCVHGQPDPNGSRTVRASGKIASVYAALVLHLMHGVKWVLIQ